MKSWVALLCHLKRAGICHNLRHEILTRYLFPFQWQTYCLRLQRAQMVHMFSYGVVHTTIHLQFVGSTFGIFCFLEQYGVVSDNHIREENTRAEIASCAWCHISRGFNLCWYVNFQELGTPIASVLELSNDNFEYGKQRQRHGRPRHRLCLKLRI